MQDCCDFAARFLWPAFKISEMDNCTYNVILNKPGNPTSSSNFCALDFDVALVAFCSLGQQNDPTAQRLQRWLKFWITLCMLAG